MKQALRVRQGRDCYAVALLDVLRVVGCAALGGEAEGVFRGWLGLGGEVVPVFDLGQALDEVATVPRVGSRILLVRAPSGGTLGLLAEEVTDTIALGESKPLPLSELLALLESMVPSLPDEVGA